MARDICSPILALVFCGLSVLALRGRQHPPQPDRPSASATCHRLLRPRTPQDCPACRRQRAQAPLAPPSPRPWRELKSRRGAPKRIATDGFACPNQACPYFRITDAQIHALVGDGTHGKHELIQTFRCQACDATFTSRRDTPSIASKHRPGESPKS